MRTFWAFLLLTAIGAVEAAGQANSASSRLAIVAVEPATAAAADMLTSEFSKEKGVQLLERGEIARVFREQQLSTANKDLLKLGQVVGAEGLMFLEVASEGTNQLMKARLVAVKPGVVVEDARVPWPKGHELESAKALVSQFKPLLPKLAVSARDALPISVLNLRAAIRTVGDQSLERELTVLVIHRLTREREVFVLERQRLGDVLFEKELKPEQESPFWTGRYLLDGTFERDGSNPDAISLNARLAPPQGGAAPISMRLAGPRTNLNALVTSLVERVLTALKRNPGPADWNPRDEARQFQAEGQWALRWGLLREAQAASESAWALGEQTKETAMLRVRSYMDGLTAAFWGSQDTGVQEFPPMPDAAKLAPVRRALEHFREDSPRFAGSHEAPDLEWMELGFRAVDQATGLLENYHRVIEARAAVEPELRELRAETRIAAAVIQTNISVRITLNYRPAWWDYQWTWGCVWYDKPEEALAAFRSVAEGEWAVGGLPPIRAWSWEDRKRIPGLLREFVDSMKRSTNDSIRLKGMLFDIVLEPAPPVGQLEPLVKELGEALWERRQQIYDRRLDAAILANFEGRVREKYHATLGEPFSDGACPEILLRIRKDYLTNAAVYNRDVFLTLFPRVYGPKHSETEARELPPLFQGFIKRLDIQPPDDDLVAASSNMLSFTGKPVTKAQPPAVVENDYVVPGTRLQIPGPVASYAPVAGMRYRDGGLWFLVFARGSYEPEKARVTAAYIVRVELADGTQQAIPMPVEYGLPSGSFVVTSNAIYAPAPGRILRFDLKEGRWESADMPVAQRANISEIGGRLYVTTPDSILEYQPATRAVKLLASARRRPAMNALDALGTTGDFDCPEVFPGPGGAVVVVVQNRVFMHQPDREEWRETAVPTFSPGSYRSYPMAGSDSLLLEVTGNTIRARLLELDLASGKIEPLVENRFVADQRDSRADRVMPSLRWNWPKEERLHGSFSLADGKSLWVLAPVGWFGPGLDPNAASLLRFEPGLPTAMKVSLRFQRGGAPIPLFNYGAWSSKNLTFISVPDGFTVAANGWLEFWHISREAVDKRLEAQRPALRAAAAAEQAWQKRALARFDINHNGALDSEERAAMLLDRECLEHDLTGLDRDGNGFLDVDELWCFDVNTNNIIEPNEWRAIQNFHRLLAEKALGKFDADHDGRLQRDEWQKLANEYLAAIPSHKASKTPEAQKFLESKFDDFDRDKSGTLDVEEIAGLLDERFNALDLDAQGYKLAEGLRPGGKAKQ